MLNIDLQQMLQEHPDDLEVVMLINGIPQYITEVKQTNNLRGLLRTKENVIILKGKLPKDYTIEKF